MARHHRLFHNHAPLVPLLVVFDYGTPPLVKLPGAWRRQVIEQAAAPVRGGT
jgi:hypothetical protein